MAAPQRLPNRIRDALGTDGEAFVSWMENVDTSLRDLRADVTGLRSDMTAMRAEMATFRQEMRADMAEFRVDIKDALHAMDGRFGQLDVKIGQVKADLMQWSFVFWVGAVGAIALLAGVLK